MLQDISKMSKTDLMSCISDRKSEIADKLKNGETEERFQIGNASYTETEWNKLLGKVDANLDEMSNPKDVITIPLSEGGCLYVNQNNITDLSQAISMFSPEDINRILRAIADYNKAQKELEEIEDEESSIAKLTRDDKE